MSAVDVESKIIHAGDISEDCLLKILKKWNPPNCPKSFDGLDRVDIDGAIQFNGSDGRSGYYFLVGKPEEELYGTLQSHIDSFREGGRDDVASYFFPDDKVPAGFYWEARQDGGIK